jgi:hypothetical protein
MKNMIIKTSTPATAIKPTALAYADVAMGLKLASQLNEWTLTMSDYELIHFDGVIALKLSQRGKRSVRVKTSCNPDYPAILLEAVNKSLNSII